MKSTFDRCLERIDAAAEDADFDGRSWNPRRREIKDHLSTLIHDVSTSTGYHFTSKIVSRINKGYIPHSGYIGKAAFEAKEDYKKPSGDTGGKYSLYRDYDEEIDN